MPRQRRLSLAKDDLQQRFAMCHSFGHEWKHFAPLGMDEIEHWSAPAAIGRAIGFPSRCTSCTTERMRWVGQSGESTNRYQYPDGYQHSAKRGDEVLTPTEWRRTYVASLFEEFGRRST